MRHAGATLGIIGQGPAGAGVKTAGIAVRSGQGLGDFRACAEAGIDQALRPQLIEGCLIKVGALGLDQRLSVDPKPQPVEILD